MHKSGTSFLSLGETADLLATTEMRILMMIKNERLRGTLIEDSWFVERSSLDGCGTLPPGAVPSGCRGCGGRCGGA